MFGLITVLLILPKLLDLQLNGRVVAPLLQAALCYHVWLSVSSNLLRLCQFDL